MKVGEGKGGRRKIGHGSVFHFPSLLFGRNKMLQVGNDRANGFRNFLFGECVAGLERLSDLGASVEVDGATLRHRNLCQ